MATYKSTKGLSVEVLAADPTTDDTVGLLYLNTTDNEFKYVRPGGLSAGAWASGGNLNTGRTLQSNGSGTQTAGLVAGGEIGPGTAQTASEEYNGSSWTEGNDLAVGVIGNAGTGTQTAALSISGINDSPPVGYVADTFHYNGTSWSEGGDTPGARQSGAACGLQTATLWHGGAGPGSSNTANVFQYNGTAWTEAGDLNTARTGHAGTGTVTAALAIANSPVAGIVEAYNGTSWTEIADLNTARDSLAGVGTQTSSLVYGGNTPPNTANTEAWDGTSWTELNNLATARRLIGGTGANNTSAMCIGGVGATAATEEWTAPDVVIKVVADS